MKITRKQLKTLIKEELNRLNENEQEQELGIQEVGDVLKGYISNIEGHVGFTIWEKLDVLIDKDDTDEDPLGKIGAFYQEAGHNGRYTFRITYRIMMKRPNKVQRLWDKEIRGKAGYHSQWLDNNGNKVFKMSLVSITKETAKPDDYRGVELVVKIVLNDKFVQEKIKEKDTSGK